MPDMIVAASAAGAQIAVAAAVTTDLIAEIRDRHDLWPTASAAVGRLTTGAALFAATNLKGNERISLQIAGNGPLGTVAADSWLLDDRSIGARGYARGQPYVGVVPLVSGEIAEDLAHYLGQSEQTPSVVALGVLANPGGIAAAGGILAQVLPGADERALSQLEQRALAMPPVTQLIAQGADAPALLRALTGDDDLRSYRTIDVRFACRCNRAKVESVLLGLGADEVLALTRERDLTEATCEYCKTQYIFTAEELRQLLERDT